MEGDEIFNAQIEVSKEVLFQEINDETVLLDLQSESYFGLDSTATRIWQLMQDAQNPKEIFDTLAGEYEVDPGVLRLDLIEHLKSLESAGLIRLINK